MIRGFQYNSRILLGWLSMLLLVSSLPAQDAYYTFYGDHPGDRLGRSVAAAGDVNNDGVLDVLVGAPDNATLGAHTGLIRVYSGQDGSILFTSEGNSAGDWLGDSISWAGDVNVDGFDDVIAGMPEDDFNSVSLSGSAWVYAGPSGNIVHTIGGTAPAWRLGASVSGLGDVNGDGHPDLLIGIPGAYGKGAAGVYSGLDGSVLHLLVGDAIADRHGSSVSLAGDVDTDGIADFVVGAPGNDVNGVGAGMARLYSGASGAILRDIHGDSADDAFGLVVRGAGDVNGDGQSDVMVGIPFSRVNGYGSGMVKVHSGSDGSTLHEIAGVQHWGFLGRAIDGAGDVNADGCADFMVGFSRYDGQYTDSGLVRIYSGLDGSTLRRIHGSSRYAYFGEAVAGIPDIDGDGWNDLIVGMPSDDVNGNESGSVRVYTQRCGTTGEIGSGCVGTGGYTPKLAVTGPSGCIDRGSSLTLEITRGLGGVGVPAGLILSPGEGSSTLPNGCTLDVALPGSRLIFLGYLSGFGDGSGFFSLSTPPLLWSGVIYLQALIGDSFVGLVATNGLRLYIPA